MYEFRFVCCFFCDNWISSEKFPLCIIFINHFLFSDLLLVLCLLVNIRTVGVSVVCENGQKTYANQRDESFGLFSPRFWIEIHSFSNERESLAQQLRTFISSEAANVVLVDEKQCESARDCSRIFSLLRFYYHACLARTNFASTAALVSTRPTSPPFFFLFIQIKLVKNRSSFFFHFLLSYLSLPQLLFRDPYIRPPVKC